MPEAISIDSCLPPANFSVDVYNMDYILITWDPPQNCQFYQNGSNAGFQGWLEIPTAGKDNAASRLVLIGYNLYVENQGVSFLNADCDSILFGPFEAGTYSYSLSAVYDSCESSQVTDSATILPKGTIQGIITDYEGVPVENAWIETYPQTYSVFSDSAGFYSIYIPVGVYDVIAAGMYYSTNAEYCLDVLENDILVLDIVLYPLAPLGFLPFEETWQYGMEDTYWSMDPDNSNWSLSDDVGNPEPCVQFNWAPTQTNYSHLLMLSIYNAPGWYYDTLNISFDISLNNYSNTGTEKLAVEMLTLSSCDPSSWFVVAEFTNKFEFDWKHITMVVPNSFFPSWEPVFLRFRAHGLDSYQINDWYIDNIKVWIPEIAHLKGIVTDILTAEPVDGAKITVYGYNPVYSDDSGYYDISVDRETYEVKCEASGYDPIEKEIYIDNITTWNILLFPSVHPEMEISPLNIVKYIAQGASCNESIEIHNSGNGSLVWNATIIEDTTMDNSRNVEWLNLSDTMGQVAPFDVQEIIMQINSQNFDFGSYSANIVFTPELNIGNGTVEVTLFVGHTDIDENGNHRFNSVYPVPAINRINFILTEYFNSLEIYSITGERIYLYDNLERAYSLNLDITSFDPGIYLFKFSDEGKPVFTEKVIILKP
ncbi:MAG: carboxypeptidase regulatory-like domain-containing protein [Bacteroidetes bacterium]|nr:carboxypeptidase regulatory-like domain-containing protein [Bacteroidota bacterium]